MTSNDRVVIILWPNRIGLYEHATTDDDYVLIDQREVTPQRAGFSGALAVDIPPEWQPARAEFAWKVDPARTISGIVAQHRARTGEGMG